MRTDLRSFLVSMAVDPDLFGQFVADARASAQEAGLSPEELEILLSAEQHLIYAELTKDRSAEESD